ncbi:f-box/lrr-repeat protein 14, partial [Quercus suber]
LKWSPCPKKFVLKWGIPSIFGALCETGLLLDHYMMGGFCSRKREQLVIEDGGCRGVSERFCKIASSKWLGNSFSRPIVDCQPGRGKCPSLMDLCIYKIREDIDKYSSFSILPRDISQQIFNELIHSRCLTDVSLKAFRDCALQDVFLGEYPGVKDSWMDFISSQGSSLLSVDISGSEVTDSGLALLKDCPNLQTFAFNYTDQLSEHGLKHISGLLKLKSLNIRCCKCVTDLDLKAISGITSLKELQAFSSNITDVGVSYLKGLHNLTMLNLEGCNITNACLESISALVALAVLNLNRCDLNDDGWEKFSGNKNLKVLSLGFNNITDACLVHLKGLTNLESLNLDSCGIGDEGLANLTGLTLLKTLELSDTEVASNGLRHLSGLTNLENLNLSFTLVNDNSLKKLSGLTSLKSLNLDARQITDAGLAALTSLTGLTHLDLFGARISDSGTKCLQYFKNLQSLEMCGGGLTDAGVKNIKDLASLTLLNLSQNYNLTDKTLELASGLTALVSLNVSNSCITREGLQYLKPLKNLRSLSLESCKVTASDIKNLQSDALPNLIRFRPE